MDGDIENVLCGRDFLESKQNGGPRKNAQEKYIIDIRCIGDGDHTVGSDSVRYRRPDRPRLGQPLF